MKIVELTKIGNPADVLELKEVPDTPLKAGDVRVKVLAAPIHPSNLLQIAGKYGTQPDVPSIPGGEGVGAVIEVSPEVTHLQVGQHVLLAGAGGTWRSEVVASAAAFIPVPAGDVEQMSMMAVNPLTAQLLLTDFADLKAGDWMIQSAANSAVGEMIIQLAALRGIKTVNIVRRDSLIPGLKALGGDVVLVDGPDLVERVKAATDGAPIVYAVDSVGGETFSRMIATLTFGATLTSYGVMSSDPSVLNVGAVIFNDIRVRGFWLAKWYETASPADKQVAFGALIPMVIGGQLKTKIDSTYPLEEIKAAVTRAGENGRDGKVLLVPAA